MWWAMFYYVTLLQLIIYLIIMVMFNSKLSNYQSVLKLAHGVVLQDKCLPLEREWFPVTVFHDFQAANQRFFDIPSTLW